MSADNLLPAPGTGTPEPPVLSETEKAIEWARVVVGQRSRSLSISADYLWLVVREIDRLRAAVSTQGADTAEPSWAVVNPPTGLMADLRAELADEVADRFRDAADAVEALGWGGTANTLRDLASQLNPCNDPEAARVAVAIQAALSSRGAGHVAEVERLRWERDAALSRVATAEVVQGRMVDSLPNGGPVDSWSERDRAVRDYEGELSAALASEETDHDPSVGATAPGVLWMAMRYALGRATYAVGECCDVIREHRGELRPWQRQRMAEEIEQALAEDRAGWGCDVKQWRATAAVLRGDPV